MNRDEYSMNSRIITDIVRGIITLGMVALIGVMHLKGLEIPDSLRLFAAASIGTYYKEVSLIPGKVKNGNGVK